MIQFPNAKINLGLNIIEKRTDGFHTIETVLYPVDLFDILEIIVTDESDTTFSSSGLMVPGDISNNLCIKAYDLLCSVYSLPPVKIHLHKVIPIGAGLGGGSSDGAFTIKMLNEMFSLRISETDMEDYARKLGSDCAFFIKNRPVYAYEKGDCFEDFDIDLSKYKIKIVSPGIHINTSEAYRWVDNYKSQTTKTESLKEIIVMPLTEWNGLLVNEFEKPVFKINQEVEIIKKKFYMEGALYASMTGSGSSVYGIFNR